MRPFSALPAALVSALLLAVPGAALAQDMLIRGGPIHTGVVAAPSAEVVLVRDGRIVFVGAEAGLPDHAGVPVIDLDGAALFPGFTDGHAHLDGIGTREMELNLEGSASVDEAMVRLEAWAAANPEGPILGRGWIETRWPEARFLTAADLDAAAPGRLVFLWRADGHAVVVSSAVLAAAGIDASTVAPSGGEILKGPDGQPTGLLVDAAMDLLGGVWRQLGENPVSPREVYRAGFAVY
ncbi:amidohydrolase family protein, partial [Brevundimonas sp.]|uniref:amidohydrolase family protein n=1 Tax=Brevundimonas sp. TaxID=1871086 RepID=UPI003AF46F28